ncbi:MAG: ATP-grasp domain-containing protein [Promethearchaeota archaeon]
MEDKTKSIIVVGFNTRPLVYSLKNAGYDVYAVDFFGDLDLYPYVKDSIIIVNALNSNYKSLKDIYSQLLVQFALQLLRRYQDVNFLLIGSGLDNNYEGRQLILEEIKTTDIKSVNNEPEIIEKARDIEVIFKFLKSRGYKIPLSYSFEKFQLQKYSMAYPFILKKKRSAGGINVFKIKDESNLLSQIKILEQKKFIPSEWLIQEYIEGTPVSCTVISNGNECEIITINRQIIGEKYLNPPKSFMYCGNIVPAELLKEEEKMISELSLSLTKNLGLKGINGFDFVLKQHYPYFMECNPRIPGSISASESALSLNLLDLHIKSFIPKEWKNIEKLIKSAKSSSVVTKLIYFAPREIDKGILPKINNLDFIYDKSEPTKNVLKGEPLCTILYSAKSFSESFNGAKKIVNQIESIIE